MNIKRCLEQPAIYNIFQKFYGGEYARKMFIDEHVKPVAGMRILDVGCGPGGVLRYLPEVNYTGIDIDERYINEARDKFGQRAKFLRSDIKNIDYEKLGSFDVIMAMGVLHHLSDEENLFLFNKIIPLLNRDGVFITIDSCLYPKQGRIKDFIVLLDRGRHVRKIDDYISLLKMRFSKVNFCVKKITIFNLAHVITKCSM